MNAAATTECVPPVPARTTTCRSPTASSSPSFTCGSSSRTPRWPGCTGCPPRRSPEARAKGDARSGGRARRRPAHGRAPPLKPKKDASPEDAAAWDEQRHRQSSERICVEHANAEHKQWRTLQRYLGRRENFDETYMAVAGLVSDRAAER